MKVGEIWRQNGETREITLLSYMGGDYWEVEMRILDEKFIEDIKNATGHTVPKVQETTISGKDVYEFYYKVSM